MDLSNRATVTAERRDFACDMEMRDGEGGTVEFDGIASVVDTPYVVRDAFGEFSETMAKGAFNKTLKERDDVRLLVNHTGVPVARTKSKTLKLSATPDLRAVAPSLDPDNPTVQELRSAMRRGDLDQMSIGFRVTRQEWNEDYTERHIREVQLFDVSVVTFPASPTTTASIRALDDAIRCLTDGEEHDPDMVRRAIAVLETLLPVEEAEAHEQIADPEYLAAVTEAEMRAFMARHAGL